jgi:uncharacterized membrane protein YsdA (DUF1294 family)
MITSLSLILLLLLILLSHFYLSLGWVLSYILSINITVLFLMGYDKFAAKQNLSRVPEKILHLYAIAGGTPFAYLSQKLFRHKTIKKSFRLKFYLILFVQIILIVLWVLWKYGYI